MTRAVAWRVLRAIAVWIAVLSITACAVNDGGIVGTGNRQDCPAAKKEDCKPVGGPTTN